MNPILAFMDLEKGFCLAHGPYQSDAQGERSFRVNRCPRWPACAIEGQLMKGSEEFWNWMAQASPDTVRAIRQDELERAAK